MEHSPSSIFSSFTFFTSFPSCFPSSWSVMSCSSLIPMVSTLPTSLGSREQQQPILWLGLPKRCLGMEGKPVLLFLERSWEEEVEDEGQEKVCLRWVAGEEVAPGASLGAGLLHLQPHILPR